ncbi:hypothetical protein [Amnibacterium endophyticum]|uniref:Uncharacterized protein n=1 Tax=Amnibacterium endophyticum TaxID=2109337 RepID=A0ABW4LDR4_9MICO
MPDDLLDRILGTGGDPRDAAAIEEARAIGRALGSVPLPDPVLPGWQSLCAGEYAEAVRVLQRVIALAHDALAVAPAAR